MKGRSHRFPSTEPHDDWVDGSWTVDCVCGVNFDDGEEMVNCDECGVWVHTRCSRYVKGDELFACDKCKNKNNRNDSEEKEVAQLLVELPTKPVRMESGYASNMPMKRPFRLWADVPMDERVHVQGVPGGDPALFGGLSSIFTRELWKSTGYVPKKFNFQYREFPCWDENENAKVKSTEENVNLASNGAGVLFSLSKERVLAAPMTSLSNSKVHLKHSKKWGSEDGDAKRYSGGMRKEKSLLRTVVVHSNKRKIEEPGVSKDRGGKKKARAAENDGEKKGGVGACKTAFRPTGLAKESEFQERGNPESFPNDSQSKNKNLNETVVHASGEINNALNSSDGQNRAPVAVPCCKELSHSDGSTGVGDVKAEQQVPVELKRSPASGDASSLERKDSESNCVKEEGISVMVDSAMFNVDGLVDDVASTAVVAEAKPITKHIDLGISGGCMKPRELKNEMDDDDICGVESHQVLPPLDAKDPGTNGGMPGSCSKLNDVALSLSPADDHNVHHVDRTSEVVNCHKGKSFELSSELFANRGEFEGSEGSLLVRRDFLETKCGSVLPQEPSKSQRSLPNTAATHGQKKVVLCFGKSTSNSSTTTKSSSIDNLKPSDSQNSNPYPNKKTIESNFSSEKDHALNRAVRIKETDDVSRKTSKEHPKHSMSTKASHQSHVSHSSFSKKAGSNSKDVVPASSTKTLSAHDIAGSGDIAGSVHNQFASQIQNKASHSGVPPRSEKSNQSHSNPSSKDAPQSTHPPVTPSSIATLSDEELALLLHQQLNSSPRVPRVPRMRNPGSLSQSASPAATTMLIKRTSSSGGKDNVLVSRRKHKDGFQSSHELDDKATKAHKVPYSPDRRRHDTEKRDGTSTKREENESSTAVHSAKKNLPPSSTATTNSGPCSSNEVDDNHLSFRSSPRDSSDDDVGTHRSPVHQTLPGLINEIMSKGKRMTYEELCSAVLPHWPNLRKHNGERYAYSSHSQAVLDCLRNRHEWARLVDRGPKTSSSKKRRKLDAEESDDSECVKGQTVEEPSGKRLESQRDDFPKGKRKARKRRRLALQGRGIKDLRKKRKTEYTDDDGAFSDSSDDSIFSEDEMQGSGSGRKGGEASGSSEETGTP